MPIRILQVPGIEASVETIMFRNPKKPRKICIALSGCGGFAVFSAFYGRAAAICVSVGASMRY